MTAVESPGGTRTERIGGGLAPGTSDKAGLALILTADTSELPFWVYLGRKD